jgi:hypothetical protein
MRQQANTRSQRPPQPEGVFYSLHSGEGWVEMRDNQLNNLRQGGGKHDSSQ